MKRIAHGLGPRERNIRAMKLIDINLEFVERPVVVDDHVVGGGKARFARGLARDDREYLLASESVATHDASDLGFDTAIDGQHAIHTRLPATRLDEQRHDDDHIRPRRLLTL